METLVAEQYYYVQLWRADYDTRATTRCGWASAPGARGSPSAPGRSGRRDASFYRHDLAEARELYGARSRARRTTARSASST